MITLRRDIETSINMGAMSESLNLTDYDKYILGRKDTAKSNFVSENSEPNYFSRDIVDYFKSAEIEKKEDSVVRENGFSSYEEYMDSVLHRTTKGERVLKREEFEARYNIKSNPNTVATATPKEANVPGKLTKAGKIFVAVYVLLVAVVAFVLIAINTFGRETVANASDVEQGMAVVEAMEEDEMSSNNWFDGVCDSLNK